MRKLNNKKSASQIITSVFLIMISILSITVIYFSIKNMIASPNLSPKDSCLLMQLKTPLKIDSACYNISTEEIEVTLKRSLDNNIPINSLDFAFNLPSSDKKFSCSDKCSNCKIIASGESKTYFFTSSEKPSNVKILVSNCLFAEKEVSECQ
jgi:hypothetical protein